MGNNGFSPSCSVIICTRDRPEQLERCLQAVSCLEYPKFDVLIVDNAPKDVRAWEVAKRWGTRYIMEPMPGVSRVRNCGALASDAEVIAYLDDDFQPEPDWLKALAFEFSDPQVMAVAGRILACETETGADELSASVLGLYIGGSDRLIADRLTPLWFELTNFGGITPGGNMAFRRSAFKVWPGFNERLGRGTLLHGGEEQYAFFSLVDRGYRVVYTPYAVVRHPISHNLQELRTRYLKDLRAATGYMTLLLVEEPRYRRATLKYITEGIRGVKRAWRYRQDGSRLRIAPWWRMMLAYLCGPLLYIRSRVDA